MRFRAWDVLFWIVIVAIIYSLVRPGSKGAAMIVALTDALAAVVGLSTGYTQRGG
jgi:hypothetical protein